MMATEIVQVDLSSAPATIRVRDDVEAVLLVITADGRPIQLLRRPRPPEGVLLTDEILRSTQAAAATTLPSRNALAPVSVIVCTHERPDDLVRCLESLAGSDRNGHEVIVVDNAPATNRTSTVVERFGMRYVIEPRLGLNRARNTGIANATHDVVAFVDDDVVVSQSWLRAIGACFADSAVGCATGLVLPLELETEAQETFELYCQYRRSTRPRVYSRAVLRSSAAAVVGIGANMAYRRQLLIDLGAFDVRLDAGTPTRAGGDTDMFARVLDAGHLIAYTPAAYVWHRHRRSARELRSAVFGYSVGTYSVLTKRLFEQRDLGALVTAGKWLIGPLMTAARATLARRTSLPWNVVLADTAGAACGPFCFGYEAWRRRKHASRVPMRRYSN